MNTNRDFTHQDAISLIVFNAKPGSGKDYAGSFLQEHFGAQRFAFADILKDLTHEFYGLESIKADHYESCKNEPSEDFAGLTPREAYIDYAENHVWPKNGKEFFAKKVIENIITSYRTTNQNNFFITDLGFHHELIELEKHFNNITVIKICCDDIEDIKDSREDISNIDENGFSRNYRSSFSYVRNEKNQSFLETIEKIANKIYRKKQDEELYF